jgi:hypothetical protein
MGNTMKRTAHLLVAAALTFVVLPIAAGDDVKHDVSTAIDAAAVNRVVIEIPYAHVTVQNGDAKKLDAYGYVARSWRTTKQRDAARVILDDSELRFDVEGATAYLRRKLGPNAQSRTARGSKSTYVIVVRVPPGTNLVTDQKKGSFTAKGRFGSIDVAISSGDTVIEVPKKNVGELIARTRWGLLEVHLGDRIIENEGFMPRKAHYFYEGGDNVVTATVTRGDITIRLRD